MKTRSHKRLLVLGLDGGDLDFIRKNVQTLPTLRDALEQGSLFEPLPPKALSGSVWPTFYNGCHPGIHGIYQHLVWNPQRMGLGRINPDGCYFDPFWKDLEQSGRKVVVLDVPYSFTGALRHGIEITDWGTHGQTLPLACNDPGVAELVRGMGKNPIGRETPVRKTRRQLDHIRESLIESAELKGRLISRVIDERDPDVLIAVFGETHRGGHTLFTEQDEDPSVAAVTSLLDVYQAVDSALENIVGNVNPDETMVLLFSVHGMTRDNAQGHLVRPLMRGINTVFLEKFLGQTTSGRNLGGIVRNLRARVPARLQHAIGAASPDRLRQWVVEREMVGGLDWSRTPGFALRTDIRTELRLNLLGREKRGMLSNDNGLQQAYVNLVRQTFLQLVDRESGTRLVDEVVAPPEMFSGERSHLLPDLVITWLPELPATRVYSPPVGEITVRPRGVRGGDHTDKGFAILGGYPAGRARLLPSLRQTEDFSGFIKHLAKDL